MGGTIAQGRGGLLDRLLPNRLLAIASLMLLAAAVIAVLRGQAQWDRVPPLVWVHLATILAATALTPMMLLRRKGTMSHRTLGYVWVGAMLLTAVTSLFFNTGGRPGNMGVFTGDFSFIHILSVWVLLQVPLIAVRARRHEVMRHEASVRGMVIGALLIAGFFTFPFQRMLGSWLFG
ncbi:DUF2306 domain-containing protein [Sandarakinorhabdus sp. DWP1-3-1]|uniref:DUF2306 domain-containing protein n=1 Tax=Sandarakinorhabdus sp. DWP1-3-1 TaxID=2804627 RepID=UPI003CF5ED54